MVLKPLNYTLTLSSKLNNIICEKILRKGVKRENSIIYLRKERRKETVGRSWIVRNGN